MSKTKKLSSDQILERFIPEFRFEEEDPTSTPERTLIFVVDQNAYYRYTSNGTYEFISGKILLHAFYRFIRHLKKNDQMPDNQPFSTAFIKDLILQLEFHVPVIIKRLSASYIAFNDKKVLNIFSGEISEISKSKHALLFVDAPSSILQDPPQSFRWLKFIEEILVTKDGAPDLDLVFYMQELFGYCLLDSNATQEAYFFFGDGQNGKSVLLGVLESLFPENLVSHSSLNSITNGAFRVASLQGKMINIVNEEESKNVKSDMFKNITSGEPITAERKYEQEFDFCPRLKLFFACNKLPVLDGVEKGVRRRVRLVPFYARISDEKKDTMLLDHLIKEERVAIILWAIEGARKFIDRGFKLPVTTAMKELLSDFEVSQSSVIEFVQENLEITGLDSDFVQKRKIFEEYRAWCEDSGRRPLSSRKFYAEISVRYEEDNVSIPKDPIYNAKTTRSERVIRGLKYSQDPTSWIGTRAPEMFVKM